MYSEGKMKRCFFFMLLFYSMQVNAQSFPFISWQIRYGNTIYIERESFNQNITTKHPKLHAIFNSDGERSYFDFNLNKDSTKILINGKPMVFYQRKAHQSKNYSMHLAYIPRKLESKDVSGRVRLKNLIIIELKKDSVVFEARVKQASHKPRKEQLKVSNSDINGLFIGPNDFWRGNLSGFMAGMAASVFALGVIKY